MSRKGGKSLGWTTWALLNSDQDEDVRENEQEESTQGNEPTISSDYELQFVGVCASKFDEPRYVTVKAVYYIRATEGQIYHKCQLGQRVNDTNGPGNH